MYVRISWYKVRKRNTALPVYEAKSPGVDQNRVVIVVVE